MENKAPSRWLQRLARLGIVAAIGALTHWNAPVMLLAVLVSVPYIDGVIVDPKLVSNETMPFDTVRITPAGDVMHEALK